MIYSLFFISGISGLIFEVMWVRLFGNIFGNTIHSASIVSSIFMFGLGVGGLVAGMVSDKKYGADPKGLLKLYAYIEIAIGGMGLLYSVLLTRLDFLSPFISTYVTGPGGWFELSTLSYVYRYGIAVLLLVPVTLLMGATLTILIRFLVTGDLGRAGWKIGALYAANTAGASLGCFSVDFFLVPAVGLYATQALAAVCNLIAGLGALKLAAAMKNSGWRCTEPVPVLQDAMKTAPPEMAAQPLLAAGCIVLAIFLSGFAGMGMEIVWFRFLSSTLGSLRATFSLMLTIILIGIWLGSVAGGYCSRRVERPVLFFIIFQGLFAASALAMFRLFSHDDTALLTSYDQSSDLVKLLSKNWSNARAILLLVGIPAFFMGTSYPLANAVMQRTESVIGKRAGLLYLSNTAGAVLGSICAAFIFLAHWGLKNSIFLLSLASLVSMLFLCIAYLKSIHRKAPLVAIVPAFGTGVILVAGLVLWSMQPADCILKKIYTGKKMHGATLLCKESLTDSIAVTETPRGFISETPERMLYVDGILMSTTIPLAQRYMRSFAHIPLLMSDGPRKVLVICFGVGNTAHAASLHATVDRIEIVDLSKNVLGHAPFFSSWNHDILKDPRVSVYVNDGRQHLRMQHANSYDLITLEPPPIFSAGVASLYSREFYEIVKTSLKEGGFCSQWLPAYQVDEAIVKSIVRAFIEVFPDCVLLSGYQEHLILVGRKQAPITIDPEKLNARIQSNPAVRDDLKRMLMGSLTELIGTFVSSYETMKNSVRAVPPVTDDYPIMEYAKTHFLHETKVPEDLFNVEEAGSWCPACFQDGRPVPLVSNLYGYLYILGQYYRSPQFLFSSPYKEKSPFQLQLPAGSRVVVEAYMQSDYLKTIFSTAQAVR